MKKRIMDMIDVNAIVMNRNVSIYNADDVFVPRNKFFDLTLDYICMMVLGGWSYEFN